MRSLRKRLHAVVLAVPVAAVGACSSPAPAGHLATTSAGAGGTSDTASATSSSGGSGHFGENFCAACEARGLVCDPWKTGCASVALTGASSTGSGNAAGTNGSNGNVSGSGSTTGNPTCPVNGLCPIICDCETSMFEVVPVAGSRQPPGELDSCQCVAGCPQQPDGGKGFSRLTGCSALVVDGGIPDAGERWDLTCYYYTSCNGGRRPEGLVERAPRARSAVGAYFAGLAHLEAASVSAFRRMARELSSLGAPEDLVQRARSAARDEIRHARITRVLALRFGAQVAPVVIAPEVQRTRLAFAIENVREGCVGETFGAALACWQAAVAADPEIKSAASAIAEDETRHAELAWDIQDWLEPQLTPSERAQIQLEREQAISRLERDVPPGEPERLWAGIPDPHDHARLVQAMRREVWGAQA